MSNFQIEGYTLPSWAVQLGITGAFPYLGPSMTPTFNNGDLIYVRPAERFLAGDVVVFYSSDDEKLIIHRVIAVGEQILTTRGDHNRNIDKPFLQGQVVGRVEFVETQRGLRRVHNGVKGLWWARLLWLRQEIDRSLRRLLRRPYTFIRQRRLVAFLWQPAVTQVCFKTDEGVLIKYLYKGRTVAVWASATGKFVCRNPFDLFIFPPDDSKFYPH